MTPNPSFLRFIMSPPAPDPSANVAKDLPADILHSIQNLLPLFEYLRFPVVCTSWRDAAASNPRPSPPCFFYFSGDRVAVARQIFPQEQRISRSAIPKPFRHRRIVSAVDNNLIVVEDKFPQGPKSKIYYLINPFSWTEIGRFPPLRTCSPPSIEMVRMATDGNFAVAVVGRKSSVLAYTRLGYHYWTDLRPKLGKARMKFWDVAASRLRKNLFYAVKDIEFNRKGSIVVSLDFSFSSSSDVACTDLTFNLRDYFSIKSESTMFGAVRVVVSSSDIYLVHWWKRKIDVYKLPLLLEGQEQRWVKAKSLGGCCFFLGLGVNHSNISVSTAEFPHLRSDSIFVENKYGFVYNLREERWKRLYGINLSYKDDLQKGKSVWINLPSMAHILLFVYLFYRTYLHYDQVKQMHMFGYLLAFVVPVALAIMNILMWFAKILRGLKKQLAKRQ